MSKEKEMSEEDKVTQAEDNMEATGITSQESGVNENMIVEEVHLVKDETEAISSSEEKHTNEGISHEEEEEEPHHIDYTNFSVKELTQSLRKLMNTGKYLKIDAQVNDIKAHFDELYNKEKETALQSFLSDGGSADDFQYRSTHEDKLFFAAYNEYREKRTEFLKDQEKQKEKNLLAKNQILDKLRELVDGEETTHSISTIKQIQEEWKKIGPVPNAFNRNLWASFNALMDRFYDNRSIYFELKELDRKKNLEHKLELCDKAEALVAHEDLKDAIKLLNELHEEFKHIGPVPREQQEDLWKRFKTASDAVYDRRKDFYDSQKEVYKENLKKKEAIVDKLDKYKTYSSPKIKEWNTITKEVLDIQKEWEGVGPVSKEAAKEINKKFWSLFKQFFHNKNVFFKELDEIRLTNKKKAEELIAKAEELMENTDWQQTSQKLVALQQEWKKIGPTPEKFRDELYNKFKAACDAFFENRRNANKQASQEFEDNLKAKEDLCSKILAESGSSNASEANLENYIKEFNNIGFVPRKNMKEILAKFNEAVDSYIKALGVEGGDKDEFLFRLNLNKLQSDPNSNKMLNKKEHGIRKQITDFENNITLWKNNLAFFASSKTADKLKDQFDEKIRKAEAEIDKLKKKLSILREF